MPRPKNTDITRSSTNRVWAVAGLLCATAVVVGALLLVFTKPHVGVWLTKINPVVTNSQQEAAPPKQVTFLAVGDIQLSRSVALKTKDNPALAFAGASELLKSADFAIGNLESPFSSSDQYIFANRFHFNAPKIYAPLLAQNNFRFLSLANNHGYDNNLDGVTTTRKILDTQGIAHTGSGTDLTEAWQGVTVTENGITVGFLSATYGVSNPGSKDNFALLSDINNLKSSISNLKSKSDFVVVMMHAGTEYVREPNFQQTDFAHAAIDYGADMVIGHHPHWIQTIERYAPSSTSIRKESQQPSPSPGKGRAGERSNTAEKYIFYSLGNFIFDQDWSQDTTEGLSVKITLSSVCHPGPDPGPMDSGSRAGMTCVKNEAMTRVSKIELLPVIIENNCCPRPARAAETAAILKKISQDKALLYQEK